MGSNDEITVCISLPNTGALSLQLKKLALTFDKILYRQPSFIIISKSLRKQGHDNKNFRRDIVDYFSDTHRECGLTIGSLKNDDLKEAIHCFNEAGIANEVFPIPKKDTDWDGVSLKNSITKIQCTDRNILKHCIGISNKVSVIDFEYNTYDLIVQSIDGNDVFEFTVVNEPKFIANTYDMLSTMYDADASCSYPVFLDQEQVMSLPIRLARFSEGLKHLKIHNSDVYHSLIERAKLGNIALKFVDEIVTDEAVNNKSPEQIVKLRDDIEECRKKISECGNWGSYPATYEQGCCTPYTRNRKIHSLLSSPTNGKI